MPKLLNSNSKVTGHSGASDWLGDVWLPALSDAGVRYMTWVYPREFFTQLQIDNVIQRCKQMEIRTFFADEEARIWLEQY
ncbi:hypothetical protein [Pontibacter roseus]|uniref:hypothetical protein n=1 Tax=Pontibacter roseus TaxID=336989 RepID=UPI0012FB2BD9|nr:hypothetical protein [Pontibacter roseus]